MTSVVPQGWVMITLAIVLGVSGFLLPIAAIIYLILERRTPRAKTQRPPKPVRQKPLTQLLDQGLAGLSHSARRAPLVLVMGARCAGKTSLVNALLGENGLPSTAFGDRRLIVRAGKEIVYVELGSELFEDRSGAGAELEKLLAKMALRTCNILLVVSAEVATHDPTGLAPIGRTAREFVEALTLRRRTAIPLRVCLTHLDRAEPGFVELARLVGGQHWEGTELRETRQGPVLAGLLHDFFRNEPLLERALVSLEPAEVDRVSALFARGSSAALARLEALYQELHVRDSGKGIHDEPLVLCAFCESNPPLLLGDPAKIDPGRVAADLSYYDRARFNRALAYGAVACLPLFVAYVWRLHCLDDAAKEVAAFQRHDARDEAGLNRAEARAGEALRRVLDPFWPPLRWAYPAYTRKVLGGDSDRRERATASRARGHAEPTDRARLDPRGDSDRGLFLQLIRKRYLDVDRAEPTYKERLYAAAVLNATSDSVVGASILKDVKRFAEVLKLPAAVVADYVLLNTAACGAATMDSTPGNWTAVQDVLARSNGVVELDTLRTAAKNACLLKTSRMGSARDPEQTALEQALRVSCATQADALVGAGDGQELPAGVRDHQAFEELLETACSDSKLSAIQAQTLLELVAQLRKLQTGNPGAERSDGNVQGACAFEGGVRERYTAAHWQQIAKQSRAADLVVWFSRERLVRSPFFTEADTAGKIGLGEQGLGATVALSQEYWVKTVQERVIGPFGELPRAMDQACIEPAQAATLRSKISEALAAYARDYQDALRNYYASFRFPYANLASFRSSLGAQLAPGSWFDRFWSTLVDNTRLDVARDPELKPLGEAVAPFSTLVALQKGGQIDLSKYSDVLRPYLTILEERSPSDPGPPLAERLSPLAKKGLSLLDPNQEAPLTQVQQVLDALGLSQDLRAPFLLPAERIQSLAIGSLERAVSDLYTRELAPSATALWQKFPFAPLGEREAAPDDVIAQLGAKGALKAAFANVIAPVVSRSPRGGYVPAKVGMQPLHVPTAALELGRWIDSVTSMLFDDAGKPKELVLSLRSDTLLRAQPGDRMVAINGHVTAGSSTVVAINQAPGWQRLSVGWTA
ncbi:MAG: hypothetical protein ACM3ZE_18470, partial [Myxococcales bacterium]